MADDLLGDLSNPPLLLVHGVTSNAGVWWRVAPALAAGGRHVIAVDMPGHGRTARTARSFCFADTASELARFIRASGLERPDLAVGPLVGGMVTAHLAAGLAPRTLVLLDPPVLTLGRLKALTEDPTERDYATLEEATAAARAANPAWSDGDVRAKAQALTEFSAELVLDVLLKNGDWDGGMAALRDPGARGVDTGSSAANGQPAASSPSSRSRPSRRSSAPTTSSPSRVPRTRRNVRIPRRRSSRSSGRSRRPRDQAADQPGAPLASRLMQSAAALRSLDDTPAGMREPTRIASRSRPPCPGRAVTPQAGPRRRGDGRSARTHPRAPAGPRPRTRSRSLRPAFASSSTTVSRRPPVARTIGGVP